MKKVLSVFLAIFVFALFTPTAFAQGEFIVDDADLLTEDLEAVLTSQIYEIQENYGVDTVIHTTMSIDEEDIYSYSKNFYVTNGYGEDGLVFVINLNNNEKGDRDFYTYYQGSIYGAFGDEAYNVGYGYVNNEILPYLVKEDYYEAFQTYLKLTESYLSGEIYSGDYVVPDDEGIFVGDYYTDGVTDDYQSELMSPVVKELIVIAVALVVAFVVTAIMKSKMNTAVIKTEASDYVKKGSMKVTRSLDIFTYRHVTKTAKPKNNSSGGRSGGGRSGGGGGKF